MNFSRIAHLVSGFAFALIFSGTAQAVILAPNSTEALPGTTVAAKPQLAGTVIEDELVAFSFAAYGGTVSGTVQQRVVRSSVDNTLDFYWRVINDASSSGAIGDFRLGEFITGTYDADWRIDGLGTVAPVSAHRFSGVFDSYVNFDFGDQLVAGSESFFFFLDTDATTYARNIIWDLTNLDQTQNSNVFSGFGPSAAVPEPGLLALLGIGLAGLFGVRRRA